MNKVLVDEKYINDAIANNTANEPCQCAIHDALVETGFNNVHVGLKSLRIGHEVYIPEDRHFWRLWQCHLIAVTDYAWEREDYHDEESIENEFGTSDYPEPITIIVNETEQTVSIEEESPY